MPGVVIANSPGVYLVDADGNTVTLDDGVTIGSAEGILIMGKDGTTARFLRIASDGTLRIDPTGTTAQPVTDNGGSLTIDASSLPLPTGAATESTLVAADGKLGTIDSVLDSIKDTDGIKKITDPLPSGTNNIGRIRLRNPGDTVDLGDATNPVRTDPTGTTAQPVTDNGGSLTIDNSNLDAALSTLATESKLELVRALLQTIDVDTSNLDVLLSTRATEATLSAADTKLGSIKDTDGIKKITDPLPVGDNIIGRAKVTDGTNLLNIVTNSASISGKTGVGILGRTETDIFRWLAVEDSGKLLVASSPPVPPPGTTEFVLAVNPSQLTVGSGGQVASPHNTDSSIIANGENLFVQIVTVGTEGDPAESGSKVELFWVEGSPATEHLVTRIYVDGATTSISFPSINLARDGTQMTGNGTNTFLRVKRTRFSNAAKEVDFSVRGFTEA